MYRAVRSHASRASRYAAALNTYRTDQTDAANDHFEEQTDIFIDWQSADYAAQETALAGLHAATQLPWTEFLVDKAEHLADWWADDGSVLYATWATDVNGQYSAYTAAVNTAYTAMVTAIADARDAFHNGTPQGAGGLARSSETVTVCHCLLVGSAKHLSIA